MTLAEAVPTYPAEAIAPRLPATDRRGWGMLAAALAGDQAILLLDEATGGLDKVTQAAVWRTTPESTATRIVIAHRLSPIRQADRALVMAVDTVAESGPPDELLPSGGLFAQLAARQEL